MRIEREIFRLQMFRGFVEGKIVQQDRAQNRAFGFHIRRKAMGQTIFTGRQDTIARLRSKIFQKRIAYYASRSCECEVSASENCVAIQIFRLPTCLSEV